MVEVDFGPTEREFKRYSLLEPVRTSDDVIDLISAGDFADQAALRRVLTFEKLKGELTNVFYSMESSNTDFYAHQFKPVMNFVESPVGRILIADEVGLGKTIEATYIWKEVQARHGARRLLIVCPAMLREKWRSDLRKRFNISAEIVSASTLLDKLTELASHQGDDSFVYIVSLESVRAPLRFEDEAKTSVRARLARLIERTPASEDFALFDQIIMDEAHYLRNSSTGNHRIAWLLRDAARHLVLLTATPIQLGSDNLYQLLRLVDPDAFFDAQLFGQVLNANSHIVRAQRALWRQPPQLSEARAAIQVARGIDYFRGDAVLEGVLPTLASGTITNAQRVDILRLLESRSLLSQYMTRSRKREVLEDRVERSAQTPALEFSPVEHALYQHVTQRIRQRAQGQLGPSLFSLISRQRQMASSLVGALESWDEKGITEELLWDDLGLTPDLLSQADDEPSSAANDDDAAVAFGASFDLAELERTDSKYRLLLDILLRELTKNPREKFVIFAFFRGTLKYLRRRLAADGIASTLLVGDMGDAKDAAIAEFAQEDGPTVLLSSEVGSEGIDLQFCRVLVNYDLPWNPMKVEQRIGRLDRLGQKAERISIINLAVQNTIEDRVLVRLYDRINVFRESIGDLEEILGEITGQLIPDLLDPTLSDEARLQRAMDTATAIENRHQLQERLEEEAVNLVGFSDYILDSIRDSRAKGRWISARELIAFVEDFFAQNYPGTSIAEVDNDGARSVFLSEEARRDLGAFIAEHQPPTRTRLHQSGRPILCMFDPRAQIGRRADTEVVGATHPLMQWIKGHYQHAPTGLYKVSATRASAAELKIEPGEYVYCVQRWSFTGLKSENMLSFAVAPAGSRTTLPAAQAEEIVFHASRAGRELPNARNVLGDLSELRATAQFCEETLEQKWADHAEAFEAENALRCQQHETSARKYAERRIADFEQRIARFERDGNQRLVPMTKGLIHREQELLAEKLNRIARSRSVDPTIVVLAAGVIRAE